MEFSDYGCVSALILIINLLSNKVTSQKNIRLVPGNVNCTNCGRLEVLINGKWGTVCSNLWSENDSRVACRQLHFLSGGKPAKYGAFGEGTGPIHMSHVDCNGNETSLMQCPRRGGASCTHEDDAGVICESESTAKQTGSVRLEDGDIRTSGRVAIQYHSVWGTICRDGWNVWNSRVVCRSLGYCGGSSVIHDHGAFGFGTGPVWLTRVKCNGNEQSVDQCQHAGWGNNSCDHGYDVGVVCEICPTGTIRLKGGQDNGTGIVSISNNGIWGTLCSSNWSDDEARVVCRSLGFRDGIAVENGNFTPQTGPIWLSGVHCNGWETHITNCYRDDYSSGGWGSNNCRHYQDVAVQCSNPLLESTTVSGTTVKYRTTRHTTASPTTDRVGATTTNSKTWIIVIVVLVAALLTVVVVAVIKVKASSSKQNLALHARGHPNDYVLSDDNEPEPCTTTSVSVPGNKPGKTRESGVYEEIDDEAEGIATHQPFGVSYNPRISGSSRANYNRKTTPLPEAPEETDSVAGSLLSDRGNSSRQETTGTSDYLVPRNLR